MEHTKSLTDEAENLNKIFDAHRPIRHGAIMIFLTAILPFAVMMLAVVYLPPYLELIPVPVAFLVVIGTFFLTFFLTRFLRGLFGPKSSTVFFREFHSRNVEGRTVAFFLGSNGQLGYVLPSDPSQPGDGRIILHLPLGGDRQQVIARQGYCDVLRQFNIVTVKCPLGESWMVNPEKNRMEFFPYVPHCERRITRDDIVNIELVLRALTKMQKQSKPPPTSSEFNAVMAEE